ncbi:MAG: hypothetical protein GY953_46220, partial [bacterium]|nr:hypothetical protein [bacterium]
VTFINPLDHRKRALEAAAINSYLAFPRATYDRAGQPERFQVLERGVSLAKSVEELP